MATILITGVAGFVGHKTADLLLESGHKVVGIDNMNNYMDNTLQEYRLYQLKRHTNFTFYYADIKEITKLEQIFSHYPFDSVIHLAAKAGVRESMNNPHIYLATNVQGTLNILETMVKHKVKKMVFASTSSVYAGHELPFREEMSANTPTSTYAATKKSAEVLCKAYHISHSLDITVVRYFTVYGPAGRPDMSYFRFIKAIDKGEPLTIFGNGMQVRDFSYIEDIAKGTIKALKHIGFEIINLGGGNGTHSLLDMIALIEERLGKKAVIDFKPFEKADMKETFANISKAKLLLDWQPTVSFENGIKNCIDWYLAHKNWASFIE